MGWCVCILLARTRLTEVIQDRKYISPGYINGELHEKLYNANLDTEAQGVSMLGQSSTCKPEEHST